MKHKYLCFPFLLLVFNINAQQNTVAAGGTGTGTGGNVNYSIGQIDYQSASGSGGNINQGVQQPYEIFNISSLGEIDGFITAVFPNPTNGIVQLTLSDLKKDLNFSVYDLSGRKILAKDISDIQTYIDLSSVASGEYLLAISSKSTTLKTIKIIKH